MKPKILRSTLEKAIYLAETTKTEHQIAISDLGTFHIHQNHVLLETLEGQWRRITKENIAQNVEKLSA